MGKKKKKNQKTPTQAAPSAGLGSLAAALGGAGLSASGKPVAAAVAAKAAAASEFKGKVVVRREKKGRGGKTATLVEGASIRAMDRDALAKTLRKALGCGARAEGDAVVVQGDQRDAVQKWLEKRGAKVVIGN